MSAPPKLKFGALEVGRGFAASVVVMHHAGSIMSQPRFYGAEPFMQHLRNFNVGVDFFFVLSGFIIAWVHWGDIGERGRLGGYAVKRFLRIYPPYWGVVIPLTLLYLLVPGSGIPTQRDPFNILMSILLLPNNDIPPVLGVAWTLVHEIFFYAVFAIVVAAGSRALVVFPLWAAAIVVAWITGLRDFPFSFFLSPFNLEFIMGVAAAWLARTRRIPFPALLAMAGTAGFVALMLFATNVQDDMLVGRLAFGPCAMLAVLGFVEMERTRPMRLPRWIAFFGAASYAVYLVHPVALSFGVQIVRRVVGLGPSLEIIAILLTIIGIAAGMFYHRTLEPILTAAVRNGLLKTGLTGAGNAPRPE